MEKFRVYGASTPEESQRERDHRALARRAAAEGMVLLKNDGVLPLRTRTVALYGPGSRMTVKGGRGSGDVRERRSVTIEEGLEAAGFSFPTTLWSDRFEEKYRADVAAWRQSVEAACKKYSPIRTMQMFIMIGERPMPYPACTPILPDELTDETDTAIYVLSRQAGEGDDRRVEKGDYLLSDVEAESLRVLSAHYKKLILVLNCGGVVDLSILDEVRIDAVLFYGQGGMEGGNALADLLTGAATPSGKLADTWACRYEDYPSADTFGHRNGNLKEEDYREGIYIGYRYFSTFGVKPRFPFGYGLSYTSFSQELLACTAEGPRIVCRVRVKNIGTGYAGREVVQLYLRKPTGKLDAEALGLAAFAKTGVLAPGSAEETVLSFDLRDLAGFDESRSCFVLEPGGIRPAAGSLQRRRCPPRRADSGDGNRYRVCNAGLPRRAELLRSDGAEKWGRVRSLPAPNRRGSVRGYAYPPWGGAGGARAGRRSARSSPDSPTGTRSPWSPEAATASGASITSWGRRAAPPQGF